MMDDLTLALPIFLIQLSFFPIVVLFHNRTRVRVASVQCNLLQLLGLLGIVMFLRAFVEESRRDEGSYNAGLKRMATLC